MLLLLEWGGFFPLTGYVETSPRTPHRRRGAVELRTGAAERWDSPRRLGPRATPPRSYEVRNTPEHEHSRTRTQQNTDTTEHAVFCCVPTVLRSAVFCVLLRSGRTQSCSAAFQGICVPLRSAFCCVPTEHGCVLLRSRGSAFRCVLRSAAFWILRSAAFCVPGLLRSAAFCVLRSVVFCVLVCSRRTHGCVLQIPREMAYRPQ